MPANDRPFAINTPRYESNANAVGAVIKFKSADVGRIQAWLDRAAEAGIIEPTAAHAYDGTYGGPVWYIP